MPVSSKVVVVMPAYNAGRTLRLTYEALPLDKVDLVLVVDDASQDDTIQVARELNLELIIHARNLGYGANQKTCYDQALSRGATVVVMVHPDYQYDPSLLPEMVRPIMEGRADVVMGSRLMGESAVRQGMPWWKYAGNRFLTGLENLVIGLNLSEYHTGYRAFRHEVLETVDYRQNSDAFVFDQEILAQIAVAGFRVTEIPVPVRYFPEASSASFWQSARYGLQILWLLGRYLLHTRGVASYRLLISQRG
jgi:glycosyltransferase involved in cell wall biosynthesis